MSQNFHPDSGNLALLRELLCCGTSILLWQYGSDGHLIATTSDSLVLDQIFAHSGGKEYMLSYAGDNSAPLVIGGQLGLMWCAVIGQNETGVRILYVLGPVFNSEISSGSIERSAREFQVDLTWREGYIRLMHTIPVVSSILFFQYALMLHYCVTGEKINRSDLQFQEWTPKSGEAEDLPKPDRMQVWLAERALLGMVREGDLNYQNAISRANLMSNGVRVSGGNPLMQAIVSCTNFTSLCVREAIQAGISPATAYSVGDSYIQNMIDCKTIPELRSINHAMYEDFILRVHRHRTNPSVSVQIQNCRDYIESHCEEDLSLSLLARRTGYSEYHLSRKFREEMGVTVSAYIRCARIERAKTLLSSTTDSISQIAAALRFSSSSHFSSVFQEITGQKPTAYRRAAQNPVPRKKQTS